MRCSGETLADLAVSWLDKDSFVAHGAGAAGAGECTLETGIARRRDLPVVVFASKPGESRGSIGTVEVEAICWALEQGRRRGWPVIGLLDSSGARIQDDLDVVWMGSDMVGRLGALAGTTPLLVGIDGACVGLAGLVAASADYCCMTQRSWLALAGPAVTQAGIGGPLLSVAELGGPEVHRASGMVHAVVPDGEAMFDSIDSVLAYTAGSVAPGWEHSFTDDVAGLVPDSHRVVFDMREVVDALVDDLSFLEYGRTWGQSLVCGFARIEGQPLGILASNAQVLSGALTTDACDKASRFVDLLAMSRLPLVQLLDTPGGMPDAGENARGLMQAYMGMTNALHRLQTMRFTVVVRRLFGGALTMSGQWRWHGDYVWAWPQASIGIMGPHAASTVRERELGDDEARERLAARHQDLARVCRSGLVDEVIEPASTRTRIATLLENWRSDPSRWER